MVTVEVSAQQPSMFDALQGSGMEQMGANMQDALIFPYAEKNSRNGK